MDQPTKIITKQKDGTHKLKYNTTKHRNKYATANIYRDTNDVRSFNSSTALREKRVHDTSTSSISGKKKRRTRKDNGEEEEEEEEIKYFGNDNDAEGLNSIGRTAVIVSSKSKLQLESPVLQNDGDASMLVNNNITQEDTKSESEESDTNEELITGGTIFLTELELSSQRNGSQLFHKLVRQLNPMCKSIAELVHYSESIVNLLYAYLLSPRTAADGGSSSESVTSIKRPNESWKAYQKHLQTTTSTNGYTVNVCTVDVLHLFGVLARELQTEIYPYLFTRIVPRIVDDMLNPPSTTTVGGEEGKQQQNVVPLDVSYIEAAFRTISYLFKYNSDQIIHNHQLPKQSTKSTQETTKKQQQVGDADILRQYYGTTICNKRDVIRRLSCESYAPILRKCTDKGLKRHLSKTIKALASSLANAATIVDEDGNEESMTFTAQRAKNDAIDGVSTLLYEIAKGSPGRIHSKKGRLVVKIILDTLLSYAGGSGGSDSKKKKDEKKSINVQLEQNKAEAVYNVTSRFLYKLRGHVAQRTQNTGGEDTASKSFQDVLDELHKALNVGTSMMMKDKSSMSTETTASTQYVSGHVIDLMIETINFQDGRLFISTSNNNMRNSGSSSAASIDRVVNSLQTLLNQDVYSNVGNKVQNQILNYLCSAWRHNPSHPSFALRLGKFFPSIVSAGNSSNDDDDTSLEPALFLGRHLLPYLPKKVAATYLIPALLGAAATSSSSADSSLVLLQTIATTVWPNNNDANEVDIDDTAVDAIFTLEAAEYCPALPAKVRSSLFDICVSSSDIDDLARLGYMSRCIPFLVCLECSGSGEGSDEEEEDEDESADDNSHLEEVLNRVFKWFAMVLKKLDARNSKKGKDQDEQGSFIVQAFILESFSKSAIECHKRISSSKVASQMEKTLSKVKTFANTLLYQHPTSLWVVKGVAAVTKALSTIESGSKLNDKSNDTFELLVTNLTQPNHYLRMYTLQILDSYPSRPFITDHAELDLTDDLDEDPSYKPQPTVDKEGELNPDGNTPVSLLSGPCNVISLMKALESIPIALPNERKFTSQLNRIEVYARTGKLPIIYAEAVTCHMLGLLHVKFSPIWPFAVKVIVSLSQAQEGPAWPYIETALKKSMKKPAVRDNNDTNALDLDDEDTSSNHTKAITNHHKLCIAWEVSKGKIVDIFKPQDKDRNAQVSRHVVSDELTLFENIWLIMQDGPHLTSTKSKIVVPIFFEFLVAQFYVFHQDEPDSREVDLTGLVESCPIWRKDELGRKALQKKLESFLKMFAAVKGPQQLFKHKILLQIFVSLLANPDARLSNLAFACVSRFKLPYLTPYVDYIHPMLKREGLREAITKFDLSEGSEIVDVEHRLLLVPIVTRILFGRFSSRGGGTNKSSKDSPAARRAAILSFFSGIGNEKGELDYFIYMMVRAFIPRDVSMQHDGVQIDKESLTTLIKSSERITAQELTSIPEKRQEGFLNLLSDVISQIGFGVKPFVGTFVNLLLSVCEQTEQAYLISIRNQLALKNEETSNELTVSDEVQDGEVPGNSRIGRIRSLAFLRLAGMMKKFASTVDFSSHSERLWTSMSTSVTALPQTVINAENTPSLLQLIETISVHHRLIPLLHQSDDAVVAVFKCIAGTTRMKVMFCVLRIIDGLLTDGGTLNDTTVSMNGESMGQSLILQHIHLLITQFTDRLTKESQQIVNLEENIGSNPRASMNRPSKHSPTEGMQLNILCRVSELLVSAEQADDDHIATMNDLCGMLVPLLKFDSHPKQLYVVRTVNSLIPRLSSAEVAMTHFHTLSKLLGPNRNQVGITSNEHRQILSSAISAICSRESECPKWKMVAQAVADVNAVSTSYVDEHDFERILPVLNRLGDTGEGSWLDLSMVRIEGTFDGTRVLLPLIYTCFQLLYDSDGVVSRAANKALKCLMAISSEQAAKDSRQTKRNTWVKLIETTFVPCLKIGITTKDMTTRRSFIMLISHLARNFEGCDSVHLYGDLKCLIRDDDLELDFFLNVTHVQLHRRGRAFNRLRRMLTTAHEDNSTAADKSSLFSDQTLSNILLPLAVHPVYEYKSKIDEAYVIEAVAVVGEICKHLSWSKYNNMLQSLLNNLPRYPDQERVLIAMLCAIVDAFHFTIDTGRSDGGEGNGVWRTLNNRIIPKVESFSIKEKVDKHGSKFKTLRASVVLALMKLFQKFPTDAFEAKLPKLITIVCNALKNKDSNTRDIARETMSKMAVGLDMKYLPLILTELSVSLSEGYKLHVRAATLHSIVVAISKIYKQPSESNVSVSVGGEATSLPFDRCVPAMLDLIHQDVYGKASEIKEAQHVEKRLIKEAMGKKSLDSLEIISRIIHFKPSVAAERGRRASTVHALVTPFLDRLRDPDVSSSTMRKVKECLQRVAVGFSTNSSAKYDEVLPFIYATVSPFVHGERKPTVDVDADLEDSDDEKEAPIQVSKSNGGTSSSRKAETKEVNQAVAVTTWAPSTLGAAESKRSAFDMKKKQKRALHKVIDGTAAPKLTGSSRHSPLKSSKAKTLNNPANACAVSFGLTLLNSSLKRSRLDVSNDELCAMADPYLSLLSHCVSFSSDNQAVMLSLRCLGIFLRMDLPSVPQAARDLGPSILDHLTTANAASNTQSDMVQSCFKTLTLLISHPKFSSSSSKQQTTVACFDDAPSSDIQGSKETLPLTSDQMQALLSLLHSAVREYDHHNSTFGLVKAISAKRFISSELYDLMDIILQLSVQSQKSAIRLQSSQIFLQYLLEYPMGKQRMDGHLHQIILNLKYEYEEGRLSAVALLASIIQKFPPPVLEERCQFFFLPLVLQLVNDDSKKCKEAVSDCISLLLQRVSTESVQSLFDYARRWSKSTGADSLPMQKASVQLLGIFIDSRSDYIKRGSNASDIMSIVLNVMVTQDERDWELLYHSLICTEKLDKQLPSLVAANHELWGALVKFMAFPHPWVIEVSSRIISSHLSTIEPTKLNESDSFVAKIPGCIYKLASNSCRQLDVEDSHFVETTSTLAIKTLVWAFRAMKQYPDMCYNDNDGEEQEEDHKSKDPCLWVMTRLSNIAKPKGERRRGSVFKCFAALCTSCDPEHFSAFLELMIDPIDRAIREATNKLGPDDVPENDPQIALSKDVLQVLEDTCGTEPFVKAYAEVNRKAREKRDTRKQQLASEAVHNPEAAAQRKIAKQLREKDRKKRRVDERRGARGAVKKRRY